MIKVEKITKKFDNRIIFSNLNKEFLEGNVYALTGKSGSGKTTLLNILANLESFDSGDIYYNDENIKKIPKQVFFRKYMGYLFQNFGLIESQTIEENLNLGLIGKKIAKEEQKKLQLSSLENVGLAYLDLNTKIYTLSGGEAQRVALAKLILKNPPLILADEPTAALDPTNANEVMNLLLSLRNDERIIILATHNPAIWEKADEVVELAML